MTKTGLAQIFKLAAKKQVFNDITKITMTLGALVTMEDSLRSSKKETNLRKNKNQLIENKELLDNPVQYKECVDNVKTDIHERLFHNFPLLSAGTMFQKIAQSKVTSIPTDQYNMNHINGAGCVTTRGIFEAHDLSSTSITLKDFVKKNASKANSGARKFVGGMDQGVPFVESDVQLEEITDMEECMEAFTMLLAVRKRACMVDCSLEPLQRFLARRAWFIWDKEYKPTNVSSAKFCAAFIDFVLQQNGARFQAELSFLTYNEMTDALKEFKMNIRGADNPRAAYGNQNKKPQGLQPKLCLYFNKPAGCNTKGRSCSTKFGVKYLHLCNVETNGTVCRGEHAAMNHKMKQELNK